MLLKQLVVAAVVAAAAVAAAAAAGPLNEQPSRGMLRLPLPVSLLMNDNNSMKNLKPTCMVNLFLKFLDEG